MNTKFILEQWVPALRSGTYRQGQKALKYTDEEGEAFCCLGVAADLLIQEGALPAWRRVTARLFGIPQPNDGSTLETSTLPNQALNHLGLGQASGRLGLVLSAMHRNDRGDSFAEIADFIENWVTEKGGKTSRDKTTIASV